MNDSNTQWNDQAIVAWNQWKERCSVNKCSEQEQMILSKEIYSAFRRVFIRLCPLRYEEILNVNFDIKTVPKIDEDEERDEPDTENETSPKDRPEESLENTDNDISEIAIAKQKMLYWPNEFDHGIIAKSNAAALEVDENDPGTGRKRQGNLWIGTSKNYKDYVWYKSSQSNDDPLKIIRGGLTSCRSGIINAIADYYLWQNHHELWMNITEAKNNKKRTKTKKEEIVQITHTSIDEPIDENGKDRGELLEDKKNTGLQENLQDEIMEAEKILADFSVFDLGLIVANAVQMQTAKETETFLKAGHTKISNYWNQILRKKAQRVFMEQPMKIAMPIIWRRLEAETGSENFLAAVRQKFIEKNLEEFL